MSFESLPPSLRILVKTEAAKRGVEPEALLEEILEGGDPLPPHISELIRTIHRWRGSAE
jgi:hypothetical protein